jgi:hypothetical protein
MSPFWSEFRRRAESTSPFWSAFLAPEAPKTRPEQEEQGTW